MLGVKAARTTLRLLWKELEEMKDNNTLVTR